MTIAERFLAELDQEVQATRALLSRLPADKWDWKPHEKSMNLGRLATHVAEIANWSSFTLKADELDFMSPEMQSWTPRELCSKEEILAELDGAVAKCRADLQSMNDEDFGQEWTMRSGDQVLMKATKYMVFRRQVLNHTLHHRAQLGVFLRLLDVPLPMMYGPTADEDGGMNG